MNDTEDGSEKCNRGTFPSRCLVQLQFVKLVKTYRGNPKIFVETDPGCLAGGNRRVITEIPEALEARHQDGTVLSWQFDA